MAFGMGYMKDRVHRNLSDSDDEENKGDFHENGWGDIQKIAETYHNWRKGENYENVKCFCKSASIEDIEKHAHVLTPGRYVGIPDEEDDGISFETKMAELTATLKQQMDKEAELNQEVATQLTKIGFQL
jgi:type I restriction enzyme M protein